MLGNAVLKDRLAFADLAQGFFAAILIQAFEAVKLSRL